jgi:hypothetical protein
MSVQAQINVTPQILGEICAKPMNEQMDLEIHRLF